MVSRAAILGVLLSDFEGLVTDVNSALRVEPTPAVRQRQLAAVKHGLYVRAPSGLKLRSRKVRRLVAKVRSVLSWLQPSDEPAVRGWCEWELVTATMFPTVLDGTGDADLWRRLMIVKLAYERELGMTP